MKKNKNKSTFSLNRTHFNLNDKKFFQDFFNNEYIKRPAVLYNSFMKSKKKYFFVKCYLDKNIRFCYNVSFLICMKMYFENKDFPDEWKLVSKLALNLINDELDNHLGESNCDGFLFCDLVESYDKRK